MSFDRQRVSVSKEGLWPLPPIGFSFVVSNLVLYPEALTFLMEMNMSKDANSTPASLNTTIWDAVYKTNPDDTKAVNFGRKFTAVDPYSQIRRATEQFGPAGIGWGWEVMEVVHLPTDQVALKIRLWHGSRDNFLEQWGQTSIYMDAKKTKPDNDCFKKATTDGLTKALSYLGFNADIFLGKFEDSKYVEQLKEEFAAPTVMTSKEAPFDESDFTQTDQTWKDWVDNQIAGFKDYETTDDLKFWKKTQTPTLNQLQQSDQVQYGRLKSAINSRNMEIKNG